MLFIGIQPCILHAFVMGCNGILPSFSAYIILIIESMNPKSTLHFQIHCYIICSLEINLCLLYKFCISLCWAQLEFYFIILMVPMFAINLQVTSITCGIINDYCMHRFTS